MRLSNFLNKPKLIKSYPNGFNLFKDKKAFNLFDETDNLVLTAHIKYKNISEISSIKPTLYKSYIVDIINSQKLKISNNVLLPVGMIIDKKNNLHELKNIPKITIDSLYLIGMNLFELPDLSKVIVDGNFSCADNSLTSLKGCPFRIKGNFNCINNDLSTLKDGPSFVKGSYSCYNNPVKFSVEDVMNNTEVKGKIEV